MLSCVFEKLMKVSVNELAIIPLYFVSLPGYTGQCGLKYTGINLQTLQDKVLILSLENNICGGISSVMGDHFVKSDESKKIIYMDATNLYGHSMIQTLPYDKIEMWHDHPDIYMIKLEEILNTPDDSDTGSFIEVDLGYPDNINKKQRTFHFVLKIETVHKEKYNDYMKKIQAKNFTKSKKLTCDWTDKKTYLIHYRFLKFFVRHRVIVDKIHEIISIKQSRLLEKYKIFKTQKRNRAKNDFEKDLYKLLNNAFYGKTMENVRNRLRLEFLKKREYKENIKQQSKLTFNGIHKPYETCDSYTFKQNEVLIDKPVYLGFTVLELGKLHMYETYYDKFQAYFGQKIIQSHYIDTDAFVLSVHTKEIIKDLKNFEDIIDFSNLDQNHELFSNKNKKVIGKYKIETPKILD